jgi:hypothetical protein
MDSLTSLGSFSASRSAKKVFNLSDVYLWQNYLMFACTVHPSSAIDHLLVTLTGEEIFIPCLVHGLLDYCCTVSQLFMNHVFFLFVFRNSSDEGKSDPRVS